MKQAAIIGAGTMGSGIAQAFAASGKWRVILCDINETLAETGRGRDAGIWGKRQESTQISPSSPWTIPGLRIWMISTGIS